MDAKAPDKTAPIGIVIPGYGHPKFLAEAIVSACTQAIDQPVFAVVVDDGCRYAETAQVTKNLMQTYAGKLFYLRQENKRLPGARNAGIDFLLSMHPDIDAVFFLDADNRLKPFGLASYRRALGDDPATGWAYPDITFFGLNWSGQGYDIRETSPDYSILRHLVGNIAEAGSMVRGDMLRAGVRFDETMRSGFEDWDYWLSAIEAGFVGVRVKDPGFMYRRRPESMLSDARRGEDALLAKMHDKHSALFNPRYILDREHRDAPAFAVIETDTGQVHLTGDPCVEVQTVAMDDFIGRLQDWNQSPRENFIPEQYLFMTSAVWSALRETRPFLRWLFWHVRDSDDDLRYCSLLPGLGMRQVTHARDAANPDITFVTASKGYVAASLDRLAAGREIQFPALQSAFILPDTNLAFGPLSSDGADKIEALKGLLGAVGGTASTVRHRDRKYAGPSQKGVREKLLEPFCAEEGRLPFPVAVPTDRLRLGVVVSDACLSSDRVYSEVADEVSRLTSAFCSHAEDVQIAMEYTEGRNLNLLVDSLDRKKEYDLIPFACGGTEQEYLVYLGRRIANNLPLQEKENAAITARLVDRLVLLGTAEHLAMLGEARHYGVKGYVFLDGGYLSREKLMADLPKLLAYEHAIEKIICGDDGIADRLAADGIPSGKILSRSDFFNSLP